MTPQPAGERLVLAKPLDPRQLSSAQRNSGQWLPPGRALAATYRAQEGTLASVQPRVDARGLSLVVEREGQQQAVGYAQNDLWPLSGRERREHSRPRGPAPGRHDGWDARRCF